MCVFVCCWCHQHASCCVYFYVKMLQGRRNWPRLNSHVHQKTCCHTSTHVNVCRKQITFVTQTFCIIFRIRFTCYFMWVYHSCSAYMTFNLLTLLCDSLLLKTDKTHISNHNRSIFVNVFAVVINTIDLKCLLPTL
jgi:hypothetical protein